jgi:UPF0716 protein FxsA
MAALLVVAFLVVPIVEIYVIIQVGQVIGPLPTVALLILESLLGAWIVKREGRRAWAALRTAATSGRLPGRELADAALVLVGGTLLLTPGFVTDVVGFFFVLPPTRPLARRVLAWFVARRAARAVGHRTPTGMPWTTRMPPRAGGAAGPNVVQGETIHEDPDNKGPDHVAGG